MYDSAEQLHATGNFWRALLATPTEPQQIKHERRVCHFPLQVGRGVGLRRRLCWPRAGTVYQRGRQHSGCADRTYPGGRNGIQNHLLGKTLSRLHRPIRLDSSRIRRQLVSLARAENGRMVVFVWTRAEYGGNWYRWPERKMEGWLCPALLKYFESPPKEIFVQASAKSS
jgi:hypothetical protein